MNTLRKTLLVGMGSLSFLGFSAYSVVGKVMTRHQHDTSHVQKATVASSQGRLKVVNQQPRPLSPTLCNYKVQTSDTLWGIAQGSGVTVPALQKMNSLHTDTIHAGQQLRVPKKYLAYAHTQKKITHTHRATAAARSQGNVATPTPVLLAGAPRSLVPVYKAAGRQYGIPWTVLAAIHKTETGFTTTNCPVSSEGAVGPMQFLPSTFETYGVKAPGHQGRPNILDPQDAIYTAARMLARDGYGRNPEGAIYNYNHSHQYVHQVMTVAGLEG